MGIRFLKIAAVYLAIGISMGLAMGITQNFTLHAVHAHINLLGWATMALAGLIYVQFPQAAETRLAKIHFWLHNLALPVMMVSLALLISGVPQAVYFLESGSTTLVAGLMMFVVNVCLNVKPETQRRGTDRAVAVRSLTAGAAVR